MKNKIILGLIIFSLVLIPFSLGVSCDPSNICTFLSDCSVGYICDNRCCVPPTIDDPGHSCSKVYTESCGPIAAQDEGSANAAVLGANDYNSANSKGIYGFSPFGVGVYGFGGSYGFFTPGNSYVGGNLYLNSLIGCNNLATSKLIVTDGNLACAEDQLGTTGTSYWSQITGGITYTGNVEVVGNIVSTGGQFIGGDIVAVGGKFIGDGSQLTGVNHAPIIYDETTGSITIIIGN